MTGETTDLLKRKSFIIQQKRMWSLCGHFPELNRNPIKALCAAMVHLHPASWEELFSFCAKKGPRAEWQLHQETGMTAVQGDRKETENSWLPRQMTGTMSVQSILKNHTICKETEKEMMSCCFPQSRSRGHRVLLLGVRTYKIQKRKTILSKK